MWQQIWHQNQAIFRSIIRSVLIDSSAVDDVLQEAYAKLMKAERRFPTPEETFSYVRRVVLNASIDHYRASRRRQARLGGACPGGGSHPDFQVRDPLAILMGEEEARLRGLILEEVRETVRRLPRRQQEALEITFNRRDRKIKDICREKGVPYSTIRSRVLAAIQTIRQSLRTKGIYHRHRTR